MSCGGGDPRWLGGFLSGSKDECSSCGESGFTEYTCTSCGKTRCAYCENVSRTCWNCGNWVCGNCVTRDNHGCRSCPDCA